MDQPVIYNSSLVVAGKLLAVEEGMITLGLVGTDYQLRLVVSDDFEGVVGKRIRGTVAANAKRVDKINAGGKYIDPVYGRPRRIQGKVVAVNREANSITVNGGCAVECSLMESQKAKDYQIGEIVGFAMERGAEFTLEK